MILLGYFCFGSKWTVNPNQSNSLYRTLGSRVLNKPLFHFKIYMKSANKRSILNAYYFIYIFLFHITVQENLFRVAGVPMVENCLSGYNSCMFAYGQVWAWGILSRVYRCDCVFKMFFVCELAAEV